jgi:hypothetical protein
MPGNNHKAGQPPRESIEKYITKAYSCIKAS